MNQTPLVEGPKGTSFWMDEEKSEIQVLRSDRPLFSAPIDDMKIFAEWWVSHGPNASVKATSEASSP